MEYIGTKEAAERLHVTQQHVSRLCRSGAFPNAKQSWDAHPWYIPVSDLEAFERSRRPGKDIFSEKQSVN